MRITFNMLTMKYLNNLNNNMNSLSDANEKVTKNRGLLRPEDNVVNYASAINIQRTIDEVTQFKRNGENALSWIKNEDSELQRATDLIIRAKNEYALAGLNDSQDATSRKALAGDVKNILDSMVDVGNANYMGRYIFAGYETQTKPFASEAREISSVSSDQNGFDVVVRKAFGDLTEPKEGEYKVKINKYSDSTVKVTVEDANGRKLFLDSNGSDETATNKGNFSSTELIAEYKPGSVINTGLGFGVKLPNEELSFIKDATIDFRFKPGNDIRYKGDDGHINTKIGYAQDVTLNMTGREVFMETRRFLEGTRFNTVNGLPVTPTTKFSQIDGADSIISDSIQINGTDHNGIRVGTARLSGDTVAELNLNNVKEADRTVTLNYAGENYTITADGKSYDNIDDLVFNLNRKLESEGLGDEIKAISDGDRIMFHTTRAGSAVKLEAKGGKNNALGFISDTLSAQGKDTIFEFGHDTYKTDPLNITYSGVSFDSNDGNITTLYINGKKLDIDNTEIGNIDELKNAINEQLQKNNLYGIVSVNVSGTLDNTDLDIKMSNESFTNNTQLAAKVVDPNTTHAYKTVNARAANYPDYDKEKTVEDLLNFISDLYGNSVKAEMVNGKLSVTDLRPGESSLSLQINESNKGIGYPSNLDIILKGDYTGTRDDSWKVSFTNGAPDTYTVTNTQGTQIKQGTIPSDYHGQPLDLGYGVSMVLPKDDYNDGESFTFDVKANGNLSFGDLNVVTEGKNVDTFRSLKNVYDALNLNIAKGGIKAPSDWEDDSLNSTAKSYFEGEFRGNYNDRWTYEVQAEGQKSEFFIQKETTAQSGELSLGSNDLSFDISYYNNRDYIFSSQTITVSPSSGNITEEELVSAINSNTNLSDKSIHAEIKNNKLVVYSGSGIQTVSLQANDVNTENALGMTENYIYSQSDTSLSLADATKDQRTLSFRDSSGIIDVIEVDAKDYANLDELVTELNNKFDIQNDNDGNFTNNNIIAVNDNGKLAFENNTGNPLVVTGDKDVTLGFYKPGDEANIKVSSSNGELINNIKLDTANKTEYIADGVRIGFDPGSLYASDSFTNTVGSGIDYELPVLDQAENQITQSLTIVGNRQNRVESVINFHDTVSTKNEEIKAKYLESRTEDMTKFITEYKQAEQAYQFAMQVASRTMQMSIMDYLR